MIDPIGVCPRCGWDDLVLNHDAPDFDDCEYSCYNCEWTGEGRELEFEDTLEDDDDDEWEL